MRQLTGRPPHLDTLVLHFRTPFTNRSPQTSSVARAPSGTRLRHYRWAAGAPCPTTRGTRHACRSRTSAPPPTRPRATVPASFSTNSPLRRHRGRGGRRAPGMLPTAFQALRSRLGDSRSETCRSAARRQACSLHSLRSSIRCCRTPRQETSLTPPSSPTGERKRPPHLPPTIRARVSRSCCLCQHPRMHFDHARIRRPRMNGSVL